MPVKNASPYLRRCLQSIVDQTINDWELIAVNDHSTDDSLSILKQFEESDSRITVLNNDGHGIIEALSLAYSYSKGEFISRMDADDEMAPNKLERLLDEISRNPEAIITSHVKYISDKPLGDGYLKYQNWLNELCMKNSHYSQIYKECVLPSPNWLMTRTTLDTLEGFENLDYPEDYDLCFKAYQNKIKIIGINEVLHNWRDYPERTSRNDTNYADNRFSRTKVRYFVGCDLNPNSTLVLWGAGKRGKMIAKELLYHKIQFEWITDNPKKIGLSIYEVPIYQSEILDEFPSCQVIIAIGSPEEQVVIKERLSGQAVFWFC